MRSADDAEATIVPSRDDASSEAAAAFDRTMRDVVMPFWSAEGTDVRSGLFWERFDLDGRPLRGVPHRLMVQARQAATFAQAAWLGRGPADAALATFDRALALFSDEGDLTRGLAFSVDPEGRVVDPTRDAYAHAFALFALAAAIRLSDELRHRQAVEALLVFIDLRLVDPLHGGLRGHWPGPPPGKAQNPTMHLFEAYLALHESWPERGFLDRAAALAALAEERLARDPPGAIREHYQDDWALGSVDAEDRTFEPGHQFEWAWLVDRYAGLAGIRPRPISTRLFGLAARHGFDEAGFCVDAVEASLNPARRTRRLWPHCEAIRAALTRPPEEEILARGVIGAALRRLNDDFLGRPFAAGWTDRLDADGRSIVDAVPASSLYHLYGAWAELKLFAGDLACQA